MSLISCSRIGGNCPPILLNLFIKNNARTTIGVFIMCLIVYVLWTTSSGNSTTTATSTSLIITSVTSSSYLSSSNNNNNNNNNKLSIQSEFDNNHHHHQQQRNINKYKNFNIIDDLINNNNNNISSTNRSPNNINLNNNNNNNVKIILRPLETAAAAAAGLTKKQSRLRSATNTKEETDTENIIIREILNTCNEQYDDKRKYIQNLPLKEYDNLPIIYFVTPTYPRREQFPEITRLGHTLMHIPKIHWIIADDSTICNPNLDNLFIKFGIPFTHLSSPMPDRYRHKSPSPRGVANRRAALKWIRNNNYTDGILYFGDDDNTFDLKLFTEIRKTKIVSMLPVGLIGEYAISSPVIKDNKVIGFFDSWPAKRKWPVDMAGFAVNLKYLSQHPNATMPYRAGHEEDAFLRSIQLNINDIEPRANNCTEILVWHTRTQKQIAPTIQFHSEYLDSEITNLGQLFKELKSLGVSHPSDSHGVKAKIIQNGKSIPFSSFFG